VCVGGRGAGVCTYDDIKIKLAQRTSSLHVTSHFVTQAHFTIMGSWVREGSVTFSILGLDKPCSTWYKIFGDLNSDKVPLIILHGGSGACHEYPLALADLTSNYSIPTIFYDQIGKGRSTHLRETAGDEAFWSVPLFLAELSNLIAQLHIDTFDLYGHSWGGMLAAEFAAGNPPGLRRLVISNSLASMATWRVGVEMLRGRLPKAVQEALERCEREGDWESEEYEGAVEVFMKRHGYLKRPWPVEEVELVVGWLKEDATTCRTLYGPISLRCPCLFYIRVLNLNGDVLCLI